MDWLNADIIEKLLAYPALLAVLYIRWTDSKTMNRMLDIIREIKTKETK